MKKIALSLIATLAIADTLQDGLSHLNSIRENTGLNSLSHNSILQTSSYNHSYYLITNNEVGHYESSVNSNFTGITPSDRMVYAGYNNYNTSENIAFGSESYINAIDSLMTAIYHRFGFLSFDINEVGFEKYEDESYYYKSVYTFNMGNTNLVDICNSSYGEISGKYYYDVCVDKELKIPAEDYNNALNTLKIQNSNIITYPYDGELNFNPVFDDTEDPDPTPNLGISGNPISIEFNDYYIKDVTLNSFKLYDSSDNEIEVEVLTSKNDTNEKLTAHQFVIFPIKRLDWNSNYRVKSNFNVDGEDFNKEFTFKTKSINYPLMEVTQNSQTLNIEANKEYAISVDSSLIEKIESLSTKFFGTCSVDIFDVNTLKISADNKCFIYLDNDITINLEIVADDGLIDITDVVTTLPPVVPETPDSNIVNLNINNGWNLLSIPVDTQSYDSSNFGEYKSIWNYIEGSWNLNPSVLNSGIGFWINANESNIVEFQGDSYKPELSSLSSGWHLLGTGESLSESNFQSDDIVWIYRDDAWSLTKDVNIGNGFWVKRN